MYANNQYYFHKFLTEKLDIPSFGENCELFRKKELMANIEKVVKYQQTKKCNLIKRRMSSSAINILNMFLNL